MPDTCDLRLYDDVTFPLPENLRRLRRPHRRLGAGDEHHQDMDIVYDLKMADKENEIHSSNADLRSTAVSFITA